MCIMLCAVVSSSLWPHGLEPVRLLCPWDFPGKSIGVSSHFLLQGIFLTHGSSPCLLHLLLWQVDSLPPRPLGSPKYAVFDAIVTLLSASSLSCVWLFVTHCAVAHQAPLSVGILRQEYWSGLSSPPAGDLPNPGIEPRSPSLQADSLPSDTLGKPLLLTSPTFKSQVCLCLSLFFNLLEYGCFTVLCYFLLYGQVNKSYINIYRCVWIPFPLKSPQGTESSSLCPTAGPQ